MISIVVLKIRFLLFTCLETEFSGFKNFQNYSFVKAPFFCGNNSKNYGYFSVHKH